MSIEQRIRETREEKGMSQSQLAKLLGSTQIEVSRIEKGNRKSYTPDLIIKISDALNVHIEWLFTGKGRKEILTSERVESFLSKKSEVLDDLTKRELILRHEETRTQLKELEGQLASILKKINFDA